MVQGDQSSLPLRSTLPVYYQNTVVVQSEIVSFNAKVRVVSQPRLNLFILACWFVFASLSCPAALAADDFELTVLHTNDIHSHDQSFLEFGASKGGFARIGHEIREDRARHSNTVVIDAGDVFQGSALYSLWHGKVEVGLLNLIGFDLVTIGNHEFDDGPENLARQLKAASYEIVCSNLDLKEEPELEALVKPYVVKEIGGRKVGFLGAITPDLARGSIALGGVKVKTPGGDWFRPIAEVAGRLSKEGVDEIVLVSHCGIDYDRQIAAAVPEIDIIVGGHSHTRLDQPIWIKHEDGSSTVLVQTGCYGRAVGELTAHFDAGGRLIESSTSERLVDIDERLCEDADLKSYIDKQSEPLAELERTVLGRADKVFRDDLNVCLWDSAMGDLVADALFETAAEHGATIVLQNRGGLRGHIEAGPITMKDAEQVLPFDNSLVVATVDGATLLETLENGLAGYLQARFLEVHGLKIGYDSSKPKGERVVFALAADTGGHFSQIDREKSYRIAINTYNFKAGEGYDFSRATNVEYCELRLSAILEEYLKRHKEISPLPPGRIVPLSPGKLCIVERGAALEAQVSEVKPHSAVTLFAGRSPGVETVTAAGDLPVPMPVPVPLFDAREIAHCLADGQGRCSFAIDRARVRALVDERDDSRSGAEENGAAAGFAGLCLSAVACVGVDQDGYGAAISYPCPLP